MQYVNNGENFGTSLFIGCLVFSIGWILIGNGKTINKEIKEIDCVEVVKTEHYVLVINDGTIYKYEEQEDFDNISDSTQFYYHKGINMYGTHSFDSDLFYINNKIKKTGEEL